MTMNVKAQTQIERKTLLLMLFRKGALVQNARMARRA